MTIFKKKLTVTQTEFAPTSSRSFSWESPNQIVNSYIK